MRIKEINTKTKCQKCLEEGTNAIYDDDDDNDITVTACNHVAHCVLWYFELKKHSSPNNN